MKRKQILTIAVMVGLFFVAPSRVSAEVLDNGEETHLIFMREEEKLARDVYLALSSLYADEQIFATIAEDSEQSHTDTVREMLAYFSINDPNPDTNNLPESIGIFNGLAYGWYFNEKYIQLINRGSENVLEALYVGAFIEELDMIDITDYPKVIVETDNGIDISQCGLAYTDEASIQNMFTNLLDGSKSHLRAYVRNIEKIIGAGNYKAQVFKKTQVS